MKRRCAFLDNCPGFNYNSGSSDYLTNDQGKREKNDTTQLGSTLMDTMIKEVGDFCDPFIRENWAMKPHHQVCVYSNGVYQVPVRTICLLHTRSGATFAHSLINQVASVSSFPQLSCLYTSCIEQLS